MRFKEFDIHIKGELDSGDESLLKQLISKTPATSEPAQKVNNPVTMFPQQQELEIAKAELGKDDPKIKAQLIQSDSDS